MVKERRRRGFKSGSPIGELLRKKRLELEISQTEMANAIGVSSSYLSSLEYGRKEITDTLIHKLAEFLKIETPEAFKAFVLVAKASAPHFNMDLSLFRNEERTLLFQFFQGLTKCAGTDPESYDYPQIRKKMEKVLGHLKLAVIELEGKLD